MPKSIDNVSKYLSDIESVIEVHDLHVWALSTTETALSVHLVVEHGIIQNDFIENIQEYVKDESGIIHSTIQPERHTGSKLQFDADCL